MKSTMVELVQELELVTPRTALIEQIINEAKAGEFHDYKNNKYACGKIAASTLLRHAGLVDLAVRLERGEFDEKPDAEDIARLRRDVIDNTSNKEEANALIKLLNLGAPI